MPPPGPAQPPTAADSAALILARLQAVQRLRQQQAADAALGARVRALKAWQSARFARTYADLLAGQAGEAYREGARFFLDELYGPQDMSARDAQFARIVPALQRLFPQPILLTVAELAELHALSESLDDAMARVPLPAATGWPAPGSYIQAWQAVGRAAERRRQIQLVLALVRALQQHTRSRLLRAGLRAMRGPAQAAGLGALQHFLERGFDTFGAMGDTARFQALIQQREQALADALDGPAAAWDGHGPPPDATLVQLPPA